MDKLLVKFPLTLETNRVGLTPNEPTGETSLPNIFEAGSTQPSSSIHQAAGLFAALRKGLQRPFSHSSCFMYNSILLTKLKFNCPMGHFLCPL